jgi:mannan endo-1,4-beta-mannosidase
MLTTLARFIKISLLLAVLCQPLFTSAALAHGDPHDHNFVQRDGPGLVLNGKDFRFAGTNNYYPMYKSQFMVDDLFSTAAAQGFTVFRMWGSLDIGNQDGTNSINGKSDGIYFQYWNGSAPAYNDGADGLQKLDYAIYRAGQDGLKVVIPFVNNWNAFGGMDQYVRWANGQYHDQFYTDPTIRQWYKNWISHLLNRTNTYSGIQYKNDPTIMTWELGNEPRCLSAGAYPQSSSCNTRTLTSWADEMSTFVKHIDHNHLVSVGDEGFYCTNPSSTDFTTNCSQGVDTLAFGRLRNVDVLSYHLYPELWGKDNAWGVDWIKSHTSQAKRIGKPVMLGEFGITNQSVRNPVYKQWTDTVFNFGGAGALYWLLSGKQDTGILYPDYDGLTVYCPSPECITLANFARQMASRRPLSFSPVADNDTALTPADTAVTVNVLSNDITYGSAHLVPGSVDLDPSTAGRQTTQSVYGGTYAAQSDGTVVFTPTAGFNGKTQITYRVSDNRGKTSNVASIVITVQPSPTGPTTLYSFEFGTAGWGPASWDPHGTVTQSTTSATEGSHSLEIDSTGGWFVVEPSPALDLSTGGQFLRFDINSPSATSTQVSLSTGSGWTWQASNSIPLAAGDNSLGIDLTTANGGGPVTDLNQVHRIGIYLGPGTYFLDFVRLDHTPPPPPPPPSSVVTLYSFESGTEGWGPASWDPQGAVSQSSAFHTDGANSLQVDTTGSGWFGLDMPVAADLTGKTDLKFDLETTTIGTSVNVALKLGSGWTWCQGSWGFVNAGTTTTVDLNLLTLTDSSSNPCNGTDLNQVHSIFVFLNGAGTYHIDNVRAQQ